MAALPDLITVEQFRQLPEGGEYAYELHHGEVVSLTRPKLRHSKLQIRLSRLLEPKLKAFGEVMIECPYRPIAEFDLRVADVAAVSHSRWDAGDPDDNLHGAPELVIEVKSPSNTRRQLQELAALCLANGTLEFWIVEADAATVSVVRAQGTAKVYGVGTSLSLAAFGGPELTVAEIFA